MHKEYNHSKIEIYKLELINIIDQLPSKKINFKKKNNRPNYREQKVVNMIVSFIKEDKKI